MEFELNNELFYRMLYQDFTDTFGMGFQLEKLRVIRDTTSKLKIEKVIALLGRKLAKEKCPVNTGELKKSIKVGFNAGHYYVYSELPYAYKVHEDVSTVHTTGEAGFLMHGLIEANNYYGNVVTMSFEANQSILAIYINSDKGQPLIEGDDSGSTDMDNIDESEYMENEDYDIDYTEGEFK